MQASAADPDVLWQIVSQKCVPNQQQHHDPSPCETVDLARGIERGHVILKGIDGATQFLLIPTARVTGIESPALLIPDAPNYWAPAWRARRYVLARARRLDSRDLHGVDPFRVLAGDIPAARADMGNWTLVAIGAKPRGFVLLAGHVDPATHDVASGDELLDHSCALASRAQ